MPEPIKIFTADNTKVPEGSTHEYSCEFEDQSGAPIALSAILSMTAWLHDRETKTVINRQAQNVKDANGGVLSAGTGGRAVFTLTLDPVDARIVNRSLEDEQHRLTLKATWTRGGALADGALTHKVLYRVVNLEVIP
jgi:hypothetical protein